MSVRIARNRRQVSRERAVRSPETEAAATREADRPIVREGGAREDDPVLPEGDGWPHRRGLQGPRGTLRRRSGADPRTPRPNDQGCDAFRRGAGEPEDGQPFDGLPAAHSCRSHSFNRTRVRSFADEAVMTR